jgi:hypothetical protein
MGRDTIDALVRPASRQKRAFCGTADALRCAVMAPLVVSVAFLLASIGAVCVSANSLRVERALAARARSLRAVPYRE